MDFVTVLFAFTVGAASQLAAASPSESNRVRDIWNPKIIYPTTGTVWESSKTYTVIWDTADIPADVIDPIGRVNLRVGGTEMPGALAEGFKLADGRVNVTAAWAETAAHYSVVLYGDSSNVSPEFTIIGYNA